MKEDTKIILTMIILGVTGILLLPSAFWAINLTLEHWETSKPLQTLYLMPIFAIYIILVVLLFISITEKKNADRK